MPSKMRKKRYGLYFKFGQHYCANPACGRYLSFDEATIDHIKPRSLGGANAYSNLQIMCQPCNLAKGDTYCAA